jgi:PAS fold
MDKLGNSYLNQLPSNIYCKNTDGVIIWHNQYVIQDLKPKIGIDHLIGKTIDDLFCPQSAAVCRSNDLEILSDFETSPIRVKQEKLSLINGEVQNYLTITNPLVNSQGSISGIMIHAININNLHEQKLLEQQIYRDYIFMLKEILIIINLMKLTEINYALQELSRELQEVTSNLLINSGLHKFINKQLLRNNENITLKI